MSERRMREKTERTMKGQYGRASSSDGRICTDRRECEIQQQTLPEASKR